MSKNQLFEELGQYPRQKKKTQRLGLKNRKATEMWKNMVEEVGEWVHPSEYAKEFGCYSGHGNPFFVLFQSL